MADFIDRVVDVAVSRTTRTISRPGFGTLLICAYHALNADRVRSYTDLDGMVADGFTPYDPAYQMAAAAFAQSPSVTKVKVGRRALAFTQVVNVELPAPVSASTPELYKIEIDGLEAGYTSDTSGTRAEVCTGLAAAINGLADDDAIVTATGSTTGEQVLAGADLDGVTGSLAMSVPRRIVLTLSSHADWDATTATIAGLDGNGNAISESLTIPNGGNAAPTTTKRFLRVTSVTIPAQSGTGGEFRVGVAAPVSASGVSGTQVVCTSPAGELHSYQRVTANVTGFTTATTNPGIATDLNAILDADSDWYGLALDSQGSAEIVAAAAWVETNKKLFVAETTDTAHLATGSLTAVGYLLKNAGYARSGLLVRRSIGLDWSAAAWFGEEFPKDAGASTWAHKRLAGISADDFTDAQRQAIESYNANHYTLLGDAPVTFPGKVAWGDYIDSTRNEDALRVDVQYTLADLLISNDKIPFTDAGISLVLAALNGVATRSVQAGILADSPAPVVRAPRASAVSAANKRARNLPDVTLDAYIAGAIHTIQARVRVSI